MEGGSVGDCSALAQTTSAWGGGVKMSGGETTLTGVSIFGCVARSDSRQAYGGGVDVYGEC